MEISQVLSQTGLTNKQSSVYLALLELGTSTVHPIANKAGIKRPTTYLILDELQAKGLVSIVPRAKKALYMAESPESLLGDLHKKQEMIKRFMPNMLALYNAKADKPQVQLFEGQQGAKEVYDKILKAKKINFFATIKDFINFYPEFADNLKRKAKLGEFEVKEILTTHPSDLAFAKSVEQSQFYRQKFIPLGEGDFLTDNVLFDNTVAFFSYQPSMFAVMITSKEITQSLRVLFDLAWQAARPYDQVIKKNPA